jgi:uncharacterized protein DUF3489
MISETPHPHLTLARQCELLGLPRSTFYHQPPGESKENLDLMRRLDELYLQLPYFGSRKFTVLLGRERRRRISRKRVQRLMRLMGIEALYPKPTTLLSRPEGATLNEIQNETGWQVHTVRGFISRSLSKQSRKVRSFERECALSRSAAWLLPD